MTIPFTYLFPSNVSWTFGLGALPLFMGGDGLLYMIMLAEYFAGSSSLIMETSVPLPPLF